MKTIIFLLLAVHGIFSLPGSVDAQSSPTDRAKLIEEAKKEGKVVVYISSTSDANDLKGAFERKYPFIKMEYYSVSKDKLLNKYLLEARNGAYLADAYQSSVFPLRTLMEKGLLAQYRSPEREAYIQDLKDKDAYWNAVYINAITMAYNTRLVKPQEVPTSYQDLALPQWKGKMGMVLSHTEWYFAILQLMGAERGHRYMEMLSKQNIQARSGTTLMNQLMNAGEFSLLVSAYPTGVEELKKTGAPIDWVPLDPYFIYPIGIALTAKNSHPAAGKLYVDFVLSEEGQTFLKSLSRIPARNHILPDPPRLIQGRKLFVIKPASSEVYNQYHSEMQRYFR